MAHRLLQDPEQDGWERSDFPIVCETCLGPNPYVRMQRVRRVGGGGLLCGDMLVSMAGTTLVDAAGACSPTLPAWHSHSPNLPSAQQIEYGGQCHISGRPYTVFRWRPGNDARYKKTIICQDVAKAKNVCQVCLLDLDYNLPVQVRDHALGAQAEQLPQSDAGKEYALQLAAETGELDARRFDAPAPPDVLLKLQRTTPYYKRNQAKICSFFVRGLCKRGAECPYRHEMPVEGPLSKQNIKDRYYGVNDPVAEKMLGRVEGMDKLTPPEDASICTLFVGGLAPEHSEDDVRDAFYSYGELRSVRKLDAKGCAFVTFASRQGAEAAAEALANRLVIGGQRCRLRWGKPQPERGPAATGSGANAAGIGPGVAYPSMDPAQAGSRTDAAGGKRPHEAVDAPRRVRPAPPPTAA